MDRSPTLYADMVRAWTPKCLACGQPLEFEPQLECVNRDCEKSPYHQVGKEAARDPRKN